MLTIFSCDAALTIHHVCLQVQMMLRYNSSYAPAGSVASSEPAGAHEEL